MSLQEILEAIVILMPVGNVMPEGFLLEDLLGGFCATISVVSDIFSVQVKFLEMLHTSLIMLELPRQHIVTADEHKLHPFFIRAKRALDIWNKTMLCFPQL